MKMTTRILNFLERRGRKLTILDRHSNEPYLTRYYLFLKDRKSFPLNIFLHKFHKGDRDDLHDHPWWWGSIIVKGGYWEHTKYGRHWRKRWSIKACSARTLHRIELEPGVDVWTIFITGKRKRDWGFVEDGVWIDHQTYLDARG